MKKEKWADKMEQLWLKTELKSYGRKVNEQ
jgi:hypothetical protein